MATCTACGHEHASDRWGGICIGCPCPERAPVAPAVPRKRSKRAPKPGSTIEDDLYEIVRLALTTEHPRENVRMYFARMTRNGGIGGVAFDRLVDEGILPIGSVLRADHAR